MGDGSEHDPDRPAPARPVRVVRFDDLGDTEDERSVRVATFGDLDGAVSPPARVASLDVARRRRRPAAEPAPPSEDDGLLPPHATDGRPRRSGTAPPRGGTGRRDRAAGAGRGEGAGRDTAADTTGGASGAAAGTDVTVVADDGVPPDGPLPRGRRRRARVGRLGPDAPDPDEPQPEADPVTVAREICLRLLTDRARTRQELAQALARKGVPAEAVATVLDRFDEVGLIDDTAFAEQWVRSRHAHRGLGRRAIAVELRRKGVADDVAREALGEVDAESEARRARELVDRKLRSLTVDTLEQRASAARRLVGMLARKGYGAGTAYGVVREALAACGADADELGVESPD